MIEPSVGISQIGVAIPKHFIKVEKVAELRGLDPGFATKGLGLLHMGIPYEESLEDLVARAVKQIDYQKIERVCLGTESDSDMSKPFAITALNKKLGLNIVPFQSKLACLGGMQALLAACEYVAAHGKPAIAVAVDRSIYEETDPTAEITSGCAAMAMKIEANPKLLALDYKRTGQYAEDIDDFRIPWANAPFPDVDGPLTKPAFLKCIKWALADWKEKNPDFGPIPEKLDYFIAHVPFAKMVEWYMAMFWKYEVLGGKEGVSIEDCLDSPELWDEYKKIIDETRKMPEFKEFFAQKVSPGLKYNPYTGNCYTASIFISLIAALEQMKQGQELGMAGYGSGAGSLILKGRATMENPLQSNLQEQIDNRKELTLEEYQGWRKRTLDHFRATPLL